jgi:peptidoglycan hydrolase CwlO-like protein
MTMEDPDEPNSSFAGVAREVSRLPKYVVQLPAFGALASPEGTVLAELCEVHRVEDVAVLIAKLEAEGRALAEARDQLAQQVEQLCGDVKAMQLDYSDELHRREAAETALGDAQRQITALRDQVASRRSVE